MNLEEILTVNLEDALGLSPASRAERDMFLERAAGTILERVALRVEAALPEEKRREIRRLFGESATEKERLAFFAREVPDLEKFMMEEILRFKREALETASNKRQ